jgi:hypothetical protein
VQERSIATHGGQIVAPFHRFTIVSQPRRRGLIKPIGWSKVPATKALFPEMLEWA